MSVWPGVPTTAFPTLHSREGELVSVSIAVEPRSLEDLLETLAALDFPINPQIYHDGAIVYLEPGGGERVEPTTLVEFPASSGRLPKIISVLEMSGFGSHAITVSPMLDEIHGGDRMEQAPPGAAYTYRILRKRAAAPAAERQ